MTHCIRCQSERIWKLQGYIEGECLKTDDDKHVYGFQSCNDIEMYFCADCGQIQGEFPLIVSADNEDGLLTVERK